MRVYFHFLMPPLAAQPLKRQDSQPVVARLCTLDKIIASDAERRPGPTKPNLAPSIFNAGESFASK
jgi:hypothetical protein